MSIEPPDPQDIAEALDSEELGADDDVDIEPGYPADQLLGADEHPEEQLGESLEDRVDREEPDLLVQVLEHPGAPAHESGADWGDEVGRLVEPGVGDDVAGIDDEPDAVARSVEEGDLSAEESAMHLTDDPPMGTRGGDYV